MGRNLQDRTRSRPPLPELRAAEHETLAWIGFYNDDRLHENLGDIPPAECEDDYYRLNYKEDNIKTLRT